uniref:Uncharacterized protein n=1 Tax=viral metagenome TaxID=1070528 RepID=A0A6H2A4V6_9ZZZZ
MGKQFEVWLKEAGVPEDRIEECMSWAFGPEYSCLPIGMLDEKWNQLHGDLFYLVSTEYLQVAIDRIGKTYMLVERGG